jgi:drug/metabolite transporter (DMT)-like permease
MFLYVFSIILIIASNPFLSLLITYLTAAVITFVFYLCNRTGKGLPDSLKDLNWTSIALGISIVGLEFGYLMAYRAGWKISVGSLVANIGLALILLPVGIIFFKETFGVDKILGAAFCIIGLILITGGRT